jgi:hypothetical protein
MPVNYYPNQTVQALELLLASLQKRQIGGAVTEVFAAGVRTVKTVGFGNSSPDVEIMRVLYSLFLAEPVNDDGTKKWTNPYLQRVTRTRPSYWTSGGYGGSQL